MTKNDRRITFPEMLIIALFSVGAAYLIQNHHPIAAETREAPTPALAPETVQTIETVPEIIVWDKGTIYDELCRGIEACDETISFPYDCTAELFDVFHEVLADHPEYFWPAGSGSYTRKTSPDGITVVFTPDSFLSREEVASRRDALEKRVADITARAEAYGTIYERLLFLHDLLVSDTEYGSETAAVMFERGMDDAISRATGAYGCLVERRAVCSGYAAAFQLLAARLGIPCRRVQGTETRTGAPHEWNIVELDGEWYHIDVTWDDPVFTGEPEEGYRSYDYFCVPTAEIAPTHIFDSETIPPCVSDTYSYYRVNALRLDSYDPDAAAALITRQVGLDCIRLKFPGEDALVPAVHDLIDHRRIFDIPAVKVRGVRSLRYSASELGTLTVWLLP